MERLITFASSPPSTLCLTTPASLRIPRDVLLEASKLSNPPFCLYNESGELNLHEVGRVYKICVKKIVGAGITLPDGLVEGVKGKSKVNRDKMRRIVDELKRIEEEIGIVGARVNGMDVPDVGEVDLERYGFMSRRVDLSTVCDLKLIVQRDGKVVDALVGVPGIIPDVVPDEIIMPAKVPSPPKEVKKKVVKTKSQIKSDEVNCTTFFTK
jgi:hypothetical protein